MRAYPILRSFILAWSSFAGLEAQVAVTLDSATSPREGLPGVTNITITGSNFPNETIPPANVNVTLARADGAVAPVVAIATAVTTLSGSSRQVSFTIPSSVSVPVPTLYVVSISGTTTAGTSFASANKASLTIDPGPTLTSIIPNAGRQAQQNLVVVIQGQLTNFVQDVTLAGFGPGVSVGGAAAGAPGPVTVLNATTVRAVLGIASDAALGPRTVVVQTGSEQLSLTNGFTVNPGAPAVTSLTPANGPRGQMLTAVMVTGAFTHFTQGTPVVTFSNPGLTANTVQATDNTHLTLTLTIAVSADTGASDVTVVTGPKTATGSGVFTVTPALPLVTSINPQSGQPGQTLTGVVITGVFTHFQIGSPVVSFSNTGITASAVQVIDDTHLTVTLTIAANAPLGASAMTVITRTETATGAGLFTVGAIAGTISAVTISPTSIPLGIATPVTTTAMVTGTPDAGSVMLQRLDSSGRVLAILGTLHDDGLNGDAKANDGIFTLVSTFTEFAIGPISLRVSATFSGAVNHVFSPIGTLTVTGTPPPTVTITAPANLSYLNLSPTTVTGTVSDPKATVVINSIAAGREWRLQRNDSTSRGAKHRHRYRDIGQRFGWQREHHGDPRYHAAARHHHVSRRPVRHHRLGNLGCWQRERYCRWNRE